MMFKKNLVLASLALATTGIVMVWGLTGCEKRPVDRNEDPVYQKRLDDRLAEREALTRKATALRRELEAAKAADPEGEKAKALESDMAALRLEFEKNRRQSEQMIRDRILRELEEKKGSKK